MFFARIENDEIVEYPVSLIQLKERHPTVSFPPMKSITDLHLEEFGYVCVRERTPPLPANEATHRVVQAVPKNQNGWWLQDFVEEELTDDEKTEKITKRWAWVRKERLGILRETDWTILPDSPLISSKRGEWKQYRQSLRDITDQPDPFNITWPTEPE